MIMGLDYLRVEGNHIINPPSFVSERDAPKLADTQNIAR